MPEKILMITSRQLCYNSAGFFADALAKEFAKAGVEVEFCRFEDSALPEAADDDLGEMDETYSLDPEISALLENYIGKSYKAVIDFNSRLPRLILEDGTPFLDHIDAPFYDYLLDNPLYHHKALRSNISNYNVITVDEHHADYIRRYYPSIRSVTVQTIGADMFARESNPAEGTDQTGQQVGHVWVPFEEKENAVLLSGTYRNPAGYMAVMEEVASKGNPMGRIMLSMSDMLLADEDLTMEEALRRILEDLGYEDETHTDPLFASQLHEFYTVEKYLRHYYRDALLWCLIKNHVPLKVMGTHWHLFPGLHPENLRVILPVDYGKSYEKIARHKILADVSPFFKHGIHDRLPVGFSSGTVVLTDDNPYKKKNLDGSDIIKTYSLKQLTDPAEGKILCDRLLEFMSDKKAYEEAREKAYDLFLEKYTWKKAAENLLRVIGNNDNKDHEKQGS